MNSSERLQAALAGAEVDRPPFSFWYNFGLQHMSGDAVADIHIAFARRFELDYLRVMNSYPYPLSSLRSFDKASDFLQIPSIVAEEGFWGHQLRALDKIVRYFKNQIWVVDSVDSPWTVLCKLSSPEMVLNAARRRPEIIKAVLDVISSSQAKYVAKAIDIGVNGIFFTLTEAAYDILDPLSHEELCQPYNNRVLEAAASAPFNILRIDSKRLYFDTLKSYRTQVVSWPHFSVKQSLRGGASEWKRSVIGGINHETIAHESPNNINAYFEKYAEEFFQPNIIIGPSGILPSDISPYVLDGIGDAVRRLPGLGRFLRNSVAREKEAEHKLNMEEYYSSRPVKEELRNYSRREKTLVRADGFTEELSEGKSDREEAAGLSLDNQDFSDSEAPVAQNINTQAEEASEEPNGTAASENEPVRSGRAPRWAARLVRRDYEREDGAEYSSKLSKDDPRRFDMAYRQNDKSGRRGDNEQRSERPAGRREGRRGSSSSNRDGQRISRAKQFREGGRRSSSSFVKNSERRERFSSKRAGRDDYHTERFGGREGRYSKNSNSYKGRRERQNSGGGVKRIRITRDRRS
ncbi:MAG: uroporphyrinogen decarboxylase family protein [Candidatus Bruticola sp.]